MYNTLRVYWKVTQAWLRVEVDHGDFRMPPRAVCAHPPQAFPPIDAPGGVLHRQQEGSFYSCFCFEIDLRYQVDVVCI